MNYITIKDIAKKLNLSVSTISRAFNNKYDIKKETRELILKTAKEMGYRPNPMAKKLVQKRSYNIGIVVPEFINAFFPEVIIGAQEIFFKKGYQVLIMQSNENYENELKNVQALENNMVDGILLSISSQTTNTDYYKDLINSGFPIVLFNRVDNSIESSRVVFNNYKWALFATEHLIDQNYKRIICLKGINSLILSHERVKGFKGAFLKRKIEIDKNQIVEAGINFEDGERAAKKMIDDNNIPDAIFACNDLCAMGAMKIFKKNGYRIPQDIAFVGFTETKFAELIDPPLTSVSQPTFEMGRKAAELLILQIENKGSFTPQTVLLNGQLNIRESSVKN